MGKKSSAFLTYYGICYPLLAVMMNPDGIKVHAVFVSKPAGEILKEHARGEESECCIYLSHSHTAWTVLAISLLSLLVILTFLIIAFVVPRHWIHWQQSHFRSKSVDVRVLEGLPCFTFYSTHLNCNQNRETCAICLEDYKDGEILKVLPCQHGRASFILFILILLNLIRGYSVKAMGHSRVPTSTSPLMSSTAHSKKQVTCR